MVETNILSYPTGPKYQLVAGEGTYILKEDLLLASHSLHPPDTQNQSANLLATSPQPVTSGTKVSLLCLEQQRTYLSDIYKSTRPDLVANNNEKGANESKGLVGAVSTSTENAGSSNTADLELALSIAATPAFGEGNSMIISNGKDTGKRKKPKNNVAKSNSSFIQRGIVHENLAKKLQQRQPHGYFAFANLNRTFQWLDLSSPQKADYLTKITFTKGHCLCHDINQATKATTHIDIIMGFSTGEIIWYEPISQKYTRLNKNGIVNPNPVSDIKWIPGSENLFLAAHIDGSLIVYDKEKDDAAFSPEENGTLTAGQPDNVNSGFEPLLHVDKSVRSKNQKHNPISIWKLSNQRINAFAFSPDSRHLAVVCEGGTLRIIDYLKEKLLDNFNSYYGGFICVCWSPDGKYVLTGGQDDLVSIWSIAESRIVARCQGHHSWVTAVCFDPWRCDNLNYRFGSVGEDCRLLLWDFSVGMLHRPKAMNMRLKGSICSWYTGLHRVETNASKIRASSNAFSHEEKEHTIEHPAEPLATTAILPPVMSKVIHDDPLCWLEFTKDNIMTSCQTGHLRIWSRPPDVDKS
ncbi:putative catabolite repression protein [Podosphaera aphanis]|nr:putative catabolite repression protein [Podosphaera aphanis]